MIRSIFKVLQGSIIAQAIGFFALPVLTRLFSPAAFGHLQFYQSILVFLLVMAAMRYEIALLNAEDGEELNTVLRLCFLINIIIALIVAIVCACAAVVPQLVPAEIKSMLWLLPLAVLVGGIFQTVSYLPLRKHAFGIGAAAKISQVASYATFGMGAGYLIGPLEVGLLIADITGRLLGILVFVIKRTALDLQLAAHITRQQLQAVASKFRQLPFISVPGGLVNVAGGVLTPLLMYNTFDVSITGQYALVERSIGLPLAMISGAVSQAFIADFAAMLRDRQTSALGLYRKIIRIMLMLGILPTLILIALSPQLFTVVFGAQWVLAGEFAQIMMPLYLVSFVTIPVNMTILMLGNQKIQFLWEVSRLAAVTTVWLVVGQYHLASKQAIMLHVTAAISMNLIYLLVTDLLLRRYYALNPNVVTVNP